MVIGLKTKPLTSLANEIELTTQVAEGNLADYIIALQGYFREQEDSFVDYYIKHRKELSRAKPVNPEGLVGDARPINKKLQSFVDGYNWRKNKSDLNAILKYINYITVPFGIENAVMLINRVAKIKERKEKASLSGIIEYANTPRFAVDTRDYILKQRTQFLREAAQISKNIDFNTSSLIYKQLYEGVENLESIRDMSVRVSDVFDGCTQNRAIMIARTETLRSFNTATIDSYKTARIANAQFIVAQDERTCDACLSLNGLIVPVAEARGSLPIHPQCRCTWIAVIGKPLLDEPSAEDLEIFVSQYPDFNISRSSVMPRASDFDKVITRIESKIKDRKTEKGFFLDDKGNIIYEKSGRRNSIPFTLKESEYFKGNIFIHNHPGASSFSVDDINIMVRYKMKEMRVIGVDHEGKVHRYIMKPKTPGIYPKGEKIRKDYKVVFKKRYSHYEKIYLDGKIGWSDTTIKLGNETWIEVTKRNKELIYISEII